MITLVLGGARSGKSQVAEKLVEPLGPVTYVATGVVADDDFASRVAVHRARRPAAWATLEVGSDLIGALTRLRGTALVDSLGTWVAATDAFAVDAKGLVATLAGRAGDTVLVSEEVGMGVHPETEIGTRFRDVLGAVNRAVADVADAVLLVVAGRVLPLDRP